MNSRWRLIAVDLDGTLIGWNHKINDRDLDALRQARAAGFHVAICTGRNSLESAGIIASLGLAGPGVFVNGAMVCDTASGAALDSQTIEEPLLDEAIDFFSACGHATLVLADDPQSRMPLYYMTDHGPPHRATTDWLLVNRVHSVQVNEIPGHLRSRIVRLGIVVNVPEAQPIHEALLGKFAGRATAHSIYSPHYDCQILEFFRNGVDKWSGLEHLAGILGIGPQQDTITIGDDINDLPMLQKAALSFAMASAAPDIQRHAKRLTASQADCGIAQVIDQLLAGSLEMDGAREFMGDSPGS